ncbi:hypothetical protein IAQ61_004573 [Plenodomus lingam]|uniref:Predicted protein n=1 Tax=Leptosphaeria maculans (strain JN3 / isolate v23.1.3 / race Av1-4-5-6-7-8) TaxID=985895 RepID=E4ZVW4_LEPMJ|nr:predicted protein [Plenodomus lingam JN3]KAH9873946.1 hypothetical protein IAQ61_004573 [Plenodomus lingam]CBX95740.1 predicted protein [Plenodomus lingam JN3]
MALLSTKPPDLIVYMAAAHHQELNNVLYGPKHGFGERILNLNMTSGHDHLVLKMPVICRYHDNLPTFTSNMVTKDEWREFCHLVEDERVVKVVFSDGRHDFRGKVVIPGTKKPKEGIVGVVFRWAEYDDELVALQQGVSWLKKKLT